jgi:hypothetical protein
MFRASARGLRGVRGHGDMKFGLLAADLANFPSGFSTIAGG